MKSDISNQLEHVFLYSANDSDGDVSQLVPILRDIQNDKSQADYIKALNTFIEEREKEIQGVCETGYQPLLSSTSSLLRIRKGTVTLRNAVGELNDGIQKSGGVVAEKKKTLLHHQQTQQNIDDTIDTLQTCLRVLDSCTGISELIDRNKYYSALRNLNTLQHTDIKPVAHLAFSSPLLASIPTSRQRIHESALKVMKTWMFEAREASQNVGRIALDAMEHRTKRWESRKKRKDVYTTTNVNGPVEMSMNERHERDALEDAPIDFGLLYQAIHIAATLGITDELRRTYQDDRRAQAELLLSQSAEGFSADTLRRVLDETVGFFVIEARVLQTARPFRTRADVDSLWERMCEQVVTLVGDGLRDCQDTDVFLSVKHTLLLFIRTLQSHDYAVQRLNSLLLTLFERYSQLLQRKFTRDFDEIVTDDDHQPMLVNDLGELEKVLSVAWLPSTGAWSLSALSANQFPFALPFSQTYPLCCIDIRSFIEQYYQFAEGFDTLRVEGVLQKSLDELLTGPVCENIGRGLDAVGNLSQLAQITINTMFFQVTCGELETLLQTLSYSGEKRVKLRASAAFAQTLSKAQQKIIDSMTLKMDSFFEESNYNLTARKATPPTPSTYLMDLMDFLSTMMDSVLSQLPQDVRDHVYTGALQHCLAFIRSFLVDEEPRHLSDPGLLYLKTDTDWILSQGAALQSTQWSGTVRPLVETLELLTEWDQTDAYSPARYPAIRKRDLAIVVGKMLDFINTLPPSEVNPGRKAKLERLYQSVS